MVERRPKEKPELDRAYHRVREKDDFFENLLGFDRPVVAITIVLIIE